MAHLANENILRKSGQKKADKASLAVVATTEVGTKLKSFTIEDVELSLRTLAYHGSNYTTTSNLLEKDYNLKVHTSTLKKWATRLFARRYAEIQEELDSEISKKLSGRLTDVAARATEVQHDIMERLADKVNDLEPNELAPTARNLSQVASPSIEKAQLIRGKPTQRTEAKDADTLLSKLAEMGMIKNADQLDLPTVEEEDIQDAEVIEEEEPDV